MKRHLIIPLLLLVTGFLHGQDFNEILYCNDSGDSIFKFSEIKERDLFYKLEPIESLQGELVFRSWGGNSCVELIQKNGLRSGVIHFATQKFTETKKHVKTFTKTYTLDRKIVNELFDKIKHYSFIRRNHGDGYPVVHTFLLKENSTVEIYTTDIPKLETEIFLIIPMNDYLDKFENEIPFKKFVDWDILKIEDSHFYQTKRNGL